MRVAILALVLLALLAWKPIAETLPHYFLFRQDLPVVAGLILTLAALAFIPMQRGTPQRASVKFVSFKVGALAALLVAVGVAGHYLILGGYALSRDEQLVLFDVEVFASGHFAARLPAGWAPYHEALNLMYMPEGVTGAGWVSMYRPVNAALHTLVGLFGDPAWTGPLLAAAGLFATWRVARRVLPDDVGSQLVAVLLYATSTQVLATSMTSYAMTGHLALNMIWLALLLHGRWYGHAGAIVIGLLAIGLHQPVYHPLFAGPFLFFCVVLQRRWALSAIYAVAYAAGIWLWGKYTALPLGELGVVGKPSDVEGFFIERMWWALSQLSPAYVWTQAANLVRFIAWQNLILLPLLITGIGVAVRTRDSRLIAMSAAIAVLIAVKLILRPYQGHGWGFRYMHGLIGVACILAAVGWRELRERGVLDRRHLTVATAATLLAATPWLLWQANRFASPFAEADRAIAATDADVVIVDNTAPEFTSDLVFNPPKLDRRPVRLLASEIETNQVSQLCARGSLAFADRRDLARIAEQLGQVPNEIGGPIPSLRGAAAASGCSVRPLTKLD